MDYLLKASGLVAILFLFYFIFLRNETFFKSIRSYFLIGLVLVLSIPLVEIPVYVEQVASQLETFSTHTEISTVPIAEDTSIDWVEIMTLVYFAGVLLFGSKFLIQLMSLGALLSKHQIIKRNNHYFVETDKNISPFSFFNIIIYNKSQFSIDELEQIINHEQVHAKQWHTLDTILSHLLVIILWFNPFVWLYKKAVQQNLEFLADSQALQQTENQQLYQFTLLKTCTNNYCAQLTNNFYNSFIKTRILMLQKNRSTEKNQWKYALILPLIAAFVFTFNTKTIAQELEVTEIHEIDEVLDGTIKIITKDFTKDDLSSLKRELKSNGIEFSYSNLKYNDQGEIIKLTVKVRNENGKVSGTWQRENQPIPNIKVGSVNGQVMASSSFKAPHTTHYSYVVTDDIDSEGNKHNFKYKIKSLDEEVGSEHHGKHEIIEIEEEIHGEHDIHEEKEIHIRTEIVNEDGIIIKVDEDDTHSETRDIIIRHEVEIDQEADNSPVIIINGKETTTKHLEKISPESIKTIEVVKSKVAKTKDGKHGKERVIYVTTKEIKNAKDSKVVISKSLDITKNAEKQPLIFIDGKESTPEEMKKLDKERIETINVSKGKKSLEKHGKKAKHGVVNITTKKK